MSKRAFLVTMVAVAVLASAVMIIGACATRKAEEEITKTDAIIESIETRKVENVTTVVETTEEETTEEETTEIPSVTKTAEELADMVLKAGINGEARKAELGDRYEEVQAVTDEMYPQLYYSDSYSYPTGDVLTPDKGVNWYGGVMETYYNLPMDGLIQLLYDLGYSGEYWVRSDGVKMFGDYIIVAADYSYEPRGTIVQTSLGTGMVLDTGEGGWAWHDIAVAW